MEKIRKIDIHVHIRAKKGIERGAPGAGTYATPEELRVIYDQIGVEKGVNLPSMGIECGHYRITNEEALDIAQAYPETLDWFCNIDPRWGKNSPETDLSYYINYYKALGAKGVGEITANLPFDEPRVLNLFYHAQACGMPLIFHIGDFGYGDYGLIDEVGLPRLEKVLRLYPKLQFLGHSQKFWAEISNDVTAENRRGYPKGRVTPGRVVELLRRYENLCGDLSAGSGFNAVSRDPEFGYAFLEEFQDRLYYGTDICDSRNITNPMLKLSAFLDEAAENGCISEAAYYKISRGNAEKLLNQAL